MLNQEADLGDCAIPEGKGTNLILIQSQLPLYYNQWFHMLAPIIVI